MVLEKCVKDCVKPNQVICPVDDLLANLMGDSLIAC